ncbi:MAG: Nif3-like dinuclear metal center hexameric protein [Candidatus Cloacimonetes bacterium]|nr:Nif3-like dinuclear metal center hexameric protein [Candidatus Cloacimonadota bacterium]
MKVKKRVADVIEVLEDFAPPKLAYSWDNVGLLIGERDSEISKVLVCLDVTPSVVEHAIKNNFSLIIAHHPLIFNPLKNVTDPLILKLIRNNVSVYVMHTNLDLVKNGVSKALADRLGLQNLKFIEQDTETYHIALYVPPEDVSIVADAVHRAGAGIIGNYSHCLNSYQVKGQFKPLEGSDPALGTYNKLEKLEETKLEFFVAKPLLDRVLNAIHTAHPYETPAYAIYPQQQSSLNYGLGIIGELANPLSLKELVILVKEKLVAPFVKLWLANESPDKEVSKIAVCGGSGSSLIEKAANIADVYISADFTYHKILESKIPLIDAGHFYTEYPILNVLKELLQPLNLDIEVLDITKADIGKLVCI